ncbi:MAG: PAS domain S-box protein, partial [Pseudomonadota bacterium]
MDRNGPCNDPDELSTRVAESEMDNGGVIRTEKACDEQGPRRDGEDREREVKAPRDIEGGYRILVETVPCGIEEIDSSGNVTFGNNWYFETLGHEPGEVYGKPVWEFLGSESERKRVGDLLVAILSERPEPFPYFRRYKTKKGRTVDLKVDWNYKTDSEGKPAGIVSVLSDATKNKQAEEVVKESEERFRALAENAPFGMLVISSTGRFDYMNSKFRTIFGYDISDVPTGKHWFRKAFPDGEYRRQVVSTWFEDLNATGEGQQRPRVFTVTCKDGTRKVIHFRPVKFVSGQHLMSCEDITERWRAEERLRQSEEEFRRIIENLHDAFYRTDLEGIITFLSPSCERISGYKPGELLGKNVAEFYADPATRSEFMKLIRERGFVDDFESMLVKKDGGIVWASTSARLYKDQEGKIAGVEGISRDITERKQMETAIRESEQMFRLLSEQSLMSVAILQDGVYRYSNEAMAALLGYSTDEITAWNP